MTGRRPSAPVNHSVLLHSPPMERKRDAGYHQHRDGEGKASPEIMLLSGVDGGKQRT